ncbi:hypothetical protein LC608_27805 [Nostoc sp. XA010]|uniref:hypothetical protein n=1 Tax=Nostoc sp. XA010 TaxID=2780407 RepID=UPI001E3ECE0D|nr:hypothetical protein [Nostoc sp. XA010]MCC5660713.1 hypothetical protein [Nostoc sp. XA010]
MILALEQNPSLGINPINCLLINSLKINNLEDAARYVKWYTYRWLIGRYHYVLKAALELRNYNWKL